MIIQLIFFALVIFALWWITPLVIKAQKNIGYHPKGLSDSTKTIIKFIITTSVLSYLYIASFLAWGLVFKQKQNLIQIPKYLVAFLLVPIGILYLQPIIIEFFKEKQEQETANIPEGYL